MGSYDSWKDLATKAATEAVLDQPVPLDALLQRIEELRVHAQELKELTLVWERLLCCFNDPDEFGDIWLRLSGPGYTDEKQPPVLELRNAHTEEIWHVPLTGNFYGFRKNLTEALKDFADNRATITDVPAVRRELAAIEAGILKTRIALS